MAIRVTQYVVPFDWVRKEYEGSREARFKGVFPYVFTRQPWALVVVVRV